MASGSSKQDAIKSATKSAVKAAAPKSYSDPYGSFNGKSGVYTPNLNATQLATQGTLQTGINNAANTVAGQSFDVNDAYNNPFFQSTYDLYAQPVNRQYESDLMALNNDLNAKGLIGGSYDALRQNKLQQNRDYNLDQASLQGRAASANAYQQQYQNALAGLQGLGQAQAQQTANIYQPFDNYVRYQSAVNPSAYTTAQAYMNQGNQLAQIPSLASTIANNAIWKPWQYTNQTLSAVRGGGAGGGGNATLQQGV